MRTVRRKLHPKLRREQELVSNNRIVNKTMTFQIAEVAVPRMLFAAILDRIDRLRLVRRDGLSVRVVDEE